MNTIPIQVTYGNPPPPVRIISDGKARYFLSLTQDEKCALYFIHPLMVASSLVKKPCLIVATHDEVAQEFDKFRTMKFSWISSTEKRPYDELVFRLWEKTHEVIAAVFEDWDQKEKELNFTEKYLRERDEAAQLCAENPERVAGIPFSSTEYHFLGSLHQHKGDCPHD